MAPSKHLIIDCDIGCDDAQAIMMALAQPQVEVCALTAVCGNGIIEDTTRNALRLMQFCATTNIPVYRGCATALLGNGPFINDFHGCDGMGDVTLPGVDPVDESVVQKEHAVVAMTRMARENPGKYTLVALGPMTNVAMALLLDPNFGKNLKDIFMMAGNLNGKGNITATAEFNTFSDPEANHVVFTRTMRNITLAPLDVCLDYSWTWEEYEKLVGTPTAKAKFVKKIDGKVTDNCNPDPTKPRKYFLWDQVAMAAAIDRSVVTAKQDVYATIELKGELTRGQMVVDWNNHYDRKPNVTIITDLDKKKYDAMVHKAVA